MGTRRKARELALHSLYQAELTATSAMDGFPLLCDNFEVSKKAIPYARELLEGIGEHWQAINELIEQHAVNWRVDRMSVIDRNIMRIAVYELHYKEELPSSVAIDEAIEIAKRYSTDDAPPFINGILDAVKKGVGQSHKPETLA